jgi:glucose/arabinose dehydrogenase
MMGVVSSIGALPVVAQPSIANTPTPASTEVRLEPIAYGLDKPVGIAVAPGQGDRLYIIEKDGLVKIFADGKVRRSVFLDIEDLVSTGTEQGLLGLAFPPSYPNDKRVFVYFTDRQGDSIIGTFSPETNDRLDEESLSVVLKIVQPAANHNGGQLAFGPDGYLYIGLGDGGGQGDPSGNAQNKSSMLGKILRIDVSETGPYKVPRDNPLSPGNHSLAEIWALGFRNPWRFSFDRATGRLFAADVGENSREEINIVERGKNYGWNTFEGTSCFKPPCDASKFTPPIAEYAHDEGRSVTGGFVYRGRKISKLNGCYIFGDHGSGTIWYLTEQANSWKREVLFKTNRHITSFGEDAEGELYVATLEGEIAKITTKE